MLAHALVVGSLGFLVAYANGSNDVSKGVATLVGSGVCDARRAIAWGTVWTGVGAFAGAFLATSLLATFGAGLLTLGTTPTFAAALATILAAAVWVLIATRTGLPVSTTHAIVGALSGVAAFAYGYDHVRWGAVSAKIALPLLASPIVSIGVTGALLRIRRASRSTADCVCATAEPVMPAADGTIESVVPRLIVAPERDCASQPSVARVTIGHLHWMTSGATSFARGMNDAPKIVALALGASAAAGQPTSSLAVFVLVAIGMIVGSVVSGLRVTRVLAENVTRMDHHEGFVANLVTSVLVGAGAGLGLPMSTTHVATGAIVGAGISRSAHVFRTKTLRDLSLAWVVTLPASAALGIASYSVLSAMLH